MGLWKIKMHLKCNCWCDVKSSAFHSIDGGICIIVALIKGWLKQQQQQQKKKTADKYVFSLSEGCG